MMEKAMNPSPLSPEQIAEIEARHEGPKDPGRCAGNMKITTDEFGCDDKCQHCGATSNETCGKWVRDAESDRAALLAHIRAQRPGVTRGQVAGEILRSRFEYGPGNIELSNNCDDDIEALKAADAILALFAHLSPQGVGERGWEDISEAPEVIQMGAECRPPRLGEYICKVYTNTNGDFWVVRFANPVGSAPALCMKLPAPPQAPEGT